MAKIFLQLDETDLAYSALKGEAHNIQIHLQNLQNFNQQFGTRWWTGGGADQFFNSLKSCIEDTLKFTQLLLSLYERVALEETEWTDIDSAYTYTHDLDNPPMPRNAEVEFWSNVTEFGLFFSLRSLMASSLPWQARYPADSDVEVYKGFSD